VCGREAAAGDRFCEADGARLDGGPSEVLVCACGAGRGHDGGDGFCDVCGIKLVPAGEEAPAPDLGAATHVGASHDTDEDAFAIGRVERDGSPLHAIVVCDGVSSSSHGEQASDHAARAALRVLLDAADRPGPLDGTEALEQAVKAAHRAACEAGIELVPGKDAPGTTIVAALAHRGRVDVAWVGDSRAYLIGAPLSDGSVHVALALTRDHSWVNMVVDAGQMTEEEAMHSPYAHALLHCIGPLEDADPGNPPVVSVGHVEAERGSRLVVCSDGLWNYAPDPEDIAGLLHDLEPGTDARGAAWHLVHHALAMGGHDDITVGVAIL
jgi:PPM family protein phosphatase